MQLIPIGDYHTHTKYSDGRATVYQMVEAARKIGLKEIAITDHGPRNIGTGVRDAETFLKIKEEVEKINRDISDFKVLVGAEANVVSCEGDIDIPEVIYRELDILLIGLHPFALPVKLRDVWILMAKNLLFARWGIFQEVKKTNTEALKKAIILHRPYAVSHPGLKMPVDVEEIALTCAQTGAYYEINTGHNFQTPSQIKTAASYGVSFIVNSDAHYTQTVGRLEAGLKKLEEAEISSHKIINILH